jgi:hypothetical protein
MAQIFDLRIIRYHLAGGATKRKMILHEMARRAFIYVPEPMFGSPHWGAGAIEFPFIFF